jgi:hypothetical protein
MIEQSPNLFNVTIVSLKHVLMLLIDNGISLNKVLKFLIDNGISLNNVLKFLIDNGISLNPCRLTELPIKWCILTSYLN